MLRRVAHTLVSNAATSTVGNQETVFGLLVREIKTDINLMKCKISDLGTDLSSVKKDVIFLACN